MVNLATKQTWAVVSQTRVEEATRWYQVKRWSDDDVSPSDPDRWECSCPDWKHRHQSKVGYHCKHIRGVIDEIVADYRKLVVGE